MIKNKIVLGTVQFGLDYGINNNKGKIPNEVVLKILDFAKSSQIEILDTAYLYGDSEKVIGEYIKIHGDNFKIISKLPPCKVSEVKNVFLESLNRLNINKVYGYLVHDFKSFKEQPDIWGELLTLKREGLISKIGFSIDFTEELEFIFNCGVKFDLVQFPYNIFDRRFEKYLAKLKNLNVEIFTRSVFLQGLFFKKPESFPEGLLKLKEKIKDLYSISKLEDVSIADLCINYVLNNEEIDYIVIGVDNLDQLKQILTTNHTLGKVGQLIYQLNRLREENEDLIVPANWSKNAHYKII